MQTFLTRVKHSIQRMDMVDVAFHIVFFTAIFSLLTVIVVMMPLQFLTIGLSVGFVLGVAYLLKKWADR